MSSVTNPVQTPRAPRISADHSRHDRLVVTRFAGGDAYPTEAAEARALIAGCAECGRLAQDIRTLISATGALPAPARQRDFRLTPQQAERMRGSFLERLLRPLASPGLSVLRPVAGVALSLGLVMAVVGGAMPGFAPAASTEDGRMLIESDKSGEPAAAPAAGGETPGAAAAPPENESAQGPGAQATYDPIDDAYTRDQTTVQPLEVADGQAGPADNLLLYAGILISALSLAVLVLVTIARHRSFDRLLR